jgi:hypothetical protein
MKLIKVKWMKNRFLIIIFLSLVFLSPLFVMGQENPVGDDTWYIINPGIDVGDRTFIKVEWRDEGSLIYWHIDFSGEVNLHFIDEEDYQSLTNGSTWDGQSVLNYDFMYTTNIEYSIVLPYEDTFYFFIVNKAGSYVDVDGWYARDETEPDGIMWGLKTNFANEILIGSTVDLGCSFNDHFDIVNMTLYENDILVETYTGSADTMVEWTVPDYKFTTLGMIEVAFKAEDQGGNIGIESKTIKIVNKLSSPPTHSEPEYFDWVGIFEDYWYIMIPVGTLLGIGVMLGLEKAGKLH